MPRTASKIAGGATALLLVAGSALIASGGPSGAVPVDATGSAFGISASGLVVIEPTPEAPPDGEVASIDQAPLLTTGVLTAEANPTATGFTSTASVADVEALAVVPPLPIPGVPPLPIPSGVTAEVLASTCTADGTELTGSSTLTGLTIAGEPVDAAAPPNTEVEIPGVATVIVNEQITSTDGQTLTVNALRIEVLPGTDAEQEITIAQSVCTLAGDDGTTTTTTAPATTAPATTAPATTAPASTTPVTAAPGGGGSPTAPGAAPIAGQPNFTG